MRRKKPIIEFRFYEIPQGQSCLPLLGDKWIKVYGEAENTLHFHNLFEIGYCRYGDGDLVLDERRLRYQTDMFTAIPANYPHTTKSKEKNFWEFFFFDAEEAVSSIYPESSSKQREALHILNKRADLLYAVEHPEVAEVIKRIMEEMRNRDNYYRETTRSLIKVLVFMLLRMHKSMDAEASKLTDNSKDEEIISINPAISYIEENYAQEIRASDLADECNMSETHFRRVFTDIINMAPMDYLNLVRIQKACGIMKKSDRSMELVATDCGFTNVSTFNRNFKKFLGTSPYQWKKNKDNYANKLLDYNIHALKGW